MNNPENPQELLECFDEQGVIIEPHTRTEVHAKPLQYWHGVVNVWLVNSAGELLCSKRAENLSGNPGKWQTYFGGHIKAGKSFKENAVLELNEEAGVEIDQNNLFLIAKGTNDADKHYFESYAYLFNGSVNDLKFNDGEVTEARWYTMGNYWAERNKNLENWCNGCKPENQELIKNWLALSTQILGINVSNISKKSALEKVVEFLKSDNQYKIFTPNPEMVVKAQKDEYFKQVLNSGDLNLCDGMGLQIFTGIKRIPGVDFMLEVCKLVAEQGRGVYLLGSGNDKVVQGACQELSKKFPNLKISGYNKGPVLQEVCHSEQSEESLLSERKGSFTSVQDDSVIVNEINQSGAAVLFVAFGMGKQEKWIYENLSKMPNVKVAMGVGGAFDFISGKINRAPLFLRKSGLEWVYRLIREPKRIGRIFNATIKFCYLVFKRKIL
ncbi:MAG: WecB/TagA/CpsF family glycosyltransferase [Candidatus Magasanikbacteria bacterium]|nr:WecB/TagA/CpsF family glycosyltransferase [Candidatus Magasanikbacteria bacterium]